MSVVLKAVVFRGWIAAIHDISSVVRVKGHLAEPFNTMRSFR